MGRTLHEVFRIREVRDHRTGGTVVALNPPDTGSNRDPEIDVLRLVQPIPGGRDRSSGGWQAETAAEPVLETLKSPEGKSQEKTVVSFRGLKKTLPLNLTNWNSIADICGDDTDDWPGHQIELYPTTTEMGGKTVDCIRVRPPSQRPLPIKQPKKRPEAPPADEF